MIRTLEQLRAQNPGKWLLIRLEGPEAETGTLLAAQEEPALIEIEMGKRFRSRDFGGRPLYVTYSIPEDEELPSFIL